MPGGKGILAQMSDDTLLSKLGSIDQNFLWASMLWGAVAGGYFIYGWKQRAVLPFLCGAAMTAASFLIPSAFWMSLTCIALVFAVHWLIKQGY